jgi:glycosyltransferase involved in cell wall biosynthesis
MLGASRYVTSSRYMAGAIRAAYGIEAEVVPPPPAMTPDGASEPAGEIEPGFLLCVARLLPYKNVDVVVEAFRWLPRERLVIVGSGPDEERVRALAGPNVHFVGTASDETLRWLYANSAGLVAASHEDYGLTPLEAASFGKPAAVLRFGGFLDTLVEGRTGVFFDELEPNAVAAGIEDLLGRRWDPAALRAHASRFSQDGFVARLRQIVQEAAG